MWNAFKLTVEQPAMVRRVGKMDELLDVAEKLGQEIQFEDGTYLAMSAHYTTDSSYTRLQNFWFPLCMTVRRQQGSQKKTTVSLCQVTLWKRKEDSRCLVMFGSSNTQENNIEGTYEEALEWIVTKVKKYFN